MMIYDISDPVTPVYVATTNISGNAWNFYAKDNFIYILTSNAIRLYDLTDPASPSSEDGICQESGQIPCDPSDVV